MDNTYIYLSSRDCKYIYPNNTGNNFTINLPQTLRLRGQWSFSLFDLCIASPGGNSKGEHLILSCNIATSSIIGDKYCRILRKFTLNNKSHCHRTFTQQQYVTVDNTSDINVINITILDPKTLSPTTVPIEKVSCTLHLKRDRPALLI
jgi:hypothetical protein